MVKSRLKKSAPECPFECEGGVIAIWAMPTYRWHQPERVFPKGCSGPCVSNIFPRRSVGTRESISLKGCSGFVLGDVFPSEAVRGPMLVMVFPRRKDMKLTRLSHLLSFASLFTIYKGVISVHFAFVFPF